MLWRGKTRIYQITALTALFIFTAFVVTGTPPAQVKVNLTPAMVSPDTTALSPKLAQAESDSAWRLFDRDTTTTYKPTQTSRITVSLSEPRMISHIRVFGASSYILNVFRDNDGFLEPVLSLTGKDLVSLGSSWNSFVPDEPLTGTHFLLEFVPQENITAGIPEVELWGYDGSTEEDTESHLRLEGIRTPAEALAILTKTPSHVIEFPASPSELSVAEGSTPAVTIGITQKPSLFKRAYILYDGYNLVRPISIQRRINSLTWAGGFVISQENTPSWSSYIEEINPAWLVQGENRIEFQATGGAATIRGLKLVIEIDSGWNSVSSTSVPEAYDGITTTSYKILASSTNPTLDITFERTIQPESLKLHLSGAMNLTGGLQYHNGTSWQDVKTGWQLNLSTMQPGWNEIAVPAPVSARALRLVFNTSGLRVKPGVPLGAVNEVRVCGSSTGSSNADPRIVISYPRDGEYFGRTVYIQGFALSAKSDSGLAEVNIEGKTSLNEDGSFSLSLSKDDTRFSSQTDDEAWDPTVRTTYAVQGGALKSLLLNKNSGSTKSPDPKNENRGNAPFSDNRDKLTDRVSPGQAKKIQYRGVTLDIPAGAVDKDTDITIVPLTEPDLARLDPGMVNVTFADAGYRFLPHGQKFLKPIKISFGYSKQLLAAGQVDDEVNMYYYDEKLLRWQKLNRMKVDAALSVVESQSDHFTDIINSTLVVPEHPQALSFNPNSIKDIKAADPSANIDVIEPPSASNMGTANLSYPIDVPNGRGAYTPDLKAAYSSNNANGWMGLGWDIPISKIQVDTRWGVPRYDYGTLETDAPKETESYMLDGAALAPFAKRPFALAMLEARSTGDKVFRKRVEGDFLRIIRKNTFPRENDANMSPYYWEVTDKTGVKYLYGQTSQARLADYDLNEGGIYQWNLEKVIDTNGNVTRFFYEIDEPGEGYTEEPFRQIYISAIIYTSHEVAGATGKKGAYAVVFNRSSSRPDVIVDGKPGFQVRTRCRLNSVDIKYKSSGFDGKDDAKLNGSIIRQYIFTYIDMTEAADYHFGKSVIKRITQKGLDGTNEFYNHEFAYQRMDKTSEGGNNYAGFKDQIIEWSGASGGHGLSEAEDKMKSVALSLSIAPTTNNPTFGLQGNYGKGDSYTNGQFLDVNGDGLTDYLKENGGVDLNHLDLNDTSRNHGYFTSAEFLGIGKLGSSKQTNFSIGGQIGYWIASANFAYSYNFVNAEKMMTDIDGDGRIDQVELSNGMQVHWNDGSKFESMPWNGYGTGHVDFGNQQASEKLKKDFFISDPVRKWTAPFKGNIRIKGSVQKVKAGKVDDPVNAEDPTDTASVVVYIYKNNEQVPLWSQKIKAEDLSTYSHDFSTSVVVGDYIYFRVNSVDDSDDDEVLWQPEIVYEDVCVMQDGAETCPQIKTEQYERKDQLGHNLLKYESGSELRLSGYPTNVWGAGVKGKVRIKGSIKKDITTDHVTLVIQRNNQILHPEGGTFPWPLALSADSTGTYEHDFTLDVAEGDTITFDVYSNTTVDPHYVDWQPEVTYEEYCLQTSVPNTAPKEYTCGRVICEPDSENVIQCGIDVDPSILPPDAKIEEKDIHQYGQPNYPIYHLYPTTLPRFWLAPYDGTVRVRGDVVRTINGKTSHNVISKRALAIVRAGEKYYLQQAMPEKIVYRRDPASVAVDRFPQDITIPVSKGDQLFFDIQSDNYLIDPAKFDWTPEITYSEYATVDTSGQNILKTLSELRSSETLTEQYCDTYDDNQDGVVEKNVCIATVCPINTAPESGSCQHCVTTSELVTDPTTSESHMSTTQTCEPITCTNDPIDGVKECLPLSFIYKSRQANIQFMDPRYYWDDIEALQNQFTAEPFAGGYRQWHYGDWNGYLSWDASLIQRTKDTDLPREDSYEGDYQSLPMYKFIYMKPQWQGVAGYANPVWGGRGQNEYIGSEQVKSSRVGANVSAVMGTVSGAGASTIQQSVSNNTAAGVSLGPAGVSFSNGDSQNKLDFMDMNGDRFPDQVSQGGVLFNNGVNGFFSRSLPPAVGTVRKIDNKNVSYQFSYTMPQNRQNAKGVTVKVTTPGASFGLSYGYSDTKSDLLDINGDGLPDRISRSGAGALVASLNLGYRFGAATTWSTDSWGMGDISNDSKRDINPDAVQINENATYNLAASFWGIGGGAGYTVARNVVALRDINGDGLPDQILKRTDDQKDYFYVKLNRGDSFGPTEIWHAPSWSPHDIADNNIASSLPGGDDAINYNATLSWNVSGGVVIMIPIIPVVTVCWIDIAPTVSVSGGKGGVELDFNDINGDGLPDHILKLKDSTSAYARINNVKDTNLLKEVRRPLGGKFTINYERRGNTVDMPHSQWVMKNVTLNDGMGRSYETVYDYGEGYYDRDERDFYGFNEVKETNSPNTGIPRTVIQTFHSKEYSDYRDYYLKGLMKRSVRIDGQYQVWAMTNNTYELKPLIAASEYPELRQTDTHFYDGSTRYDNSPTSTYGSKKYTYERFYYDGYGNVTSFEDAGELVTPSDDRTATIHYFEDANDYIVGKPDEILVKNGATTLRKRWSLYDNKTGNLRTLSSLIKGSDNSTFTMTYDDYGNVETITDPVGYMLTYTYDDVVRNYPTSVTDNFQPSYYSEAAYDYKFGQPVLMKDLNANHQLDIYDEFGRLQYIYGPLDTNADGSPSTSAATISFEYLAPTLNAENEIESYRYPARAITKNKAVSRVGSDGNIEVITFVDGMKRVIQSKHETERNGVYGMTVSGLVVFDELGRGKEKGQPIFQSSTDATPLDAYVAQSLPKNPTIFTYDPLDRVTSNMVPYTTDTNATAYALTTMTYGFLHANQGGPLYATTTVVDPEGNKSVGMGGTTVVSGSGRGTKVTYKDVDDKVAAVFEYKNGSAIKTFYEHDPMGQLVIVTDNELHATIMEYDLMGRRLSIDNPDTGKTEYDYDANGNLTSKLSANYQVGKAISYEYEFNRLKKIVYPNSTPVEYTYGVMGAANNSANRIVKVTDESGTEERRYGSLGETVWEKKTVEAKTPAVQRKSFTTEYLYDSFGRMREMTYPDGEKLTYTYDSGGLLNAAWGEKSGNRYNYIVSLMYDEFDQKTEANYGNGTKTTYVYDPQSRRLTSLTTTLRNGRHIQDLAYTYDLVGNVTKLKNNLFIATNTALPAGPVEQNYRFDDLYQLEHADGTYTFGPGKGNSYTNDFLYDTIGNMTQKAQVHKIIQPSLSEHLPKETNYVLNYAYSAQNKPHAVRDAGDKLYSYDPAGNMTGWTHKTNGTRRVISWNEENRVKQIDDNGKATYFLYDDTGERVVKRGQHGETIYVNRFYAVRNGELGTKHIYAGETRVLSKLVKTPNTATSNTTMGSSTSSGLATGTTTSIPGANGLDNGRGKKLGIIKRLPPGGNQTGVTPPVEKDFFYYHSDHLGSSNMITNDSGEIYQHLEYFPYGEAWIEEGGRYGGNTPGYKFTGKELDPETGLYYYGARYYDPVLSKWLSTDPMLDRYMNGNPDGGIYVPQNLGVYTYAHNNPVIHVDPQGKWVLKAARIAWKVAVKGENLYSMVSGVVENAKVIADPDAGWGAKLLAAGDIALDVTTGFRVKDVVHAAKVAEKALSLKKDVQKLENKIDQLKRGQQSEKRVLKSMGLEGKKGTVKTKEGISHPDAMTDKMSVEVKDTKKVSATKQIRIQTDAAKESGRESVLVTGTNTKVSKEAERRFDRIERRADLGPKE